jgi:hypothetical protein
MLRSLISEYEPYLEEVFSRNKWRRFIPGNERRSGAKELETVLEVVKRICLLEQKCRSLFLLRTPRMEMSSFLLRERGEL